MLKNINEESRQAWLATTLRAFPKGARLLDAGAGELKNRKYCEHLEYVSQDFCQYQGAGHLDEGLQTQGWCILRALILPVTSPKYPHRMPALTPSFAARFLSMYRDPQTHLMNLLVFSSLAVC